MRNRNPIGTDAQKRRKNGRSSVAQRTWYKEVRQRMRNGEEHCRRCGKVSTNLILGHKIANVHGGGYSRANLVVMCRGCDNLQGDRPITDLPTLAEEAGVVSDLPRTLASEA